jgi:hypothetical protein
MKTSIRISLFSLGAALVGFWPAGAGAQVSALQRCALASPGSLLGLAPSGAAAHAAMIQRTLKCLQGANGQAPAAASAGVGGQFVTFDPPRSTNTTPTGITPDGTITGYYNDAGGMQHGFLRDSSGSFTTFDPPGSTYTYVGSISPNGEIAGAYCNTITCYGFVRAGDGTITTFNAPGASSKIFAPLYAFALPPGINPAGAVAGTYSDTSGEHGFLRAKNGAFTTIDAPGSTGNTEIFAINPSGVMVGDLFPGAAGFLRFPNGSFATIESPDVCPNSTFPSGGINPAGVVAGSALDPSCSLQDQPGFVRTPDGTVTTFGAPPGFSSTNATAINPAGWITGLTWNDASFSGYHGFLRSPDGVTTTFDPPGAVWTWPLGINPAGAIVGFLYDGNFVAHGFLRLP